MVSFASIRVGAEQALVMLIILAITFFFMKVARTLFKRYFDHSSKKIKVDPTQYNFLRHTITALIFFVGVGFAIYSVPTLRTLSISLFAGAGILAVVVGFASQQALSNVISGIMIVVFRPFRVGDWISIGPDTKGSVEDITLRHTIIRNRENKRIIVPNSVISNDVIENSHIGDKKACRLIEIGISYDANINKAMKIMREEAKKHKFFIDNRTPEQKKEKVDPVRVEVMGFDESSVLLRAWVWAPNPEDGFSMHLQLNKAIKERFDKEGVEIPFPYRTLVYKKDLEAAEKGKKQ